MPLWMDPQADFYYGIICGLIVVAPYGAYFALRGTWRWVRERAKRGR